MSRSSARAARPGDAIFVSGSPGDAAAGLALEQSRLHVADPMSAQILRDRFLFPTPRCDVGVALRGLASACIDVSDGLGGDLEKLCAASGCGAEVDAAALPVSEALCGAVGRELAREYALTGGDDYELLFTVPLARLGAMTNAMALGLGPVTRIGSLVAGNGVRVIRARWCDAVLGRRIRSFRALDSDGRSATGDPGSGSHPLRGCGRILPITVSWDSAVRGSSCRRIGYVAKDVAASHKDRPRCAGAEDPGKPRSGSHR